MNKKTFDHLLSPWVFVLTGIVFNILSAVITHYFIGLNNERISTLERQIHDRQVLIDSLWQSRVEVERKKEFFIIYLSGSEKDSELANEYYRSYLGELADTHRLGRFDPRIEASTMTDLELLLELSDAARNAMIDSINETYLESLDLQEAKLPLERANSRLYSIAIFLQVTGLILVLAKDLRRQ